MDSAMLSLHDSANRAVSPVERRSEPRVPTTGAVVLETTGPGSRRIHGQLVDASAHGYRLQHSYFELNPGHEVTVVEGLAARRLRVVWTRIEGELVESGFLVLD
jgi:hypothetical protein